MWRSIDADLLANIVGDEPADGPIYEAGRNLVAWCLQGDPNDRPTMAQILAHAFFAPAAPLATVPARKHLFLSHFQKEGAGTAHALFHALRQVGAHAWLDMFEDDLTAPGMKRGVEESDVFVLILTTNVLTREFCRLEIGWALAARKPILVVREDDARFAAFDYDRWRADEVWDDDVGWTVPADAALRPYSSLGATPELRAIRDVIQDAYNSFPTFAYSEGCKGMRTGVCYTKGAAIESSYTAVLNVVRKYATKAFKGSLISDGVSAANSAAF